MEVFTLTIWNNWIYLTLIFLRPISLRSVVLTSLASRHWVNVSRVK